MSCTATKDLSKFDRTHTVCLTSSAGCLYDGRERANGDTWDDASDPCAVCVCREGSIRCERKRCPPTNCKHPVQRQCCMSCDGEWRKKSQQLSTTSFIEISHIILKVSKSLVLSCRLHVSWERISWWHWVQWWQRPLCRLLLLWRGGCLHQDALLWRLQPPLQTTRTMLWGMWTYGESIKLHHIHNLVQLFSSLQNWLNILQ